MSLAAEPPTVGAGRRRRLLVRSAVVVVLLALGVLVAAVSGGASDGGDGDYRVRIVFDNASFVIPGEQLKVAGAVAGTVESLDLTADNKAVAVVRVSDPAFRPFRADASCSIGLQALIGEQFVDCKPTQPRATGTPLPPPLPAITRGPGRGQHLIPVERTTSPGAFDLVTNTLRMPERERVRLIVAELGAGVAGNGETLRAALFRANPALQQADQLVKILADQSRTIDQLVADTDTVLQPLAARRADLGTSIERIGDVAAAAASRGNDLEQSFARLPAFLDQLKPATARISALADQAGPVVAGLSKSGPALSDAIRTLTPFARAATPAFESVGRLSTRGRAVLPDLRSLVVRLGEVADPLRPVARELAGMLTSGERAGGIESLMQTLYFYSGSINGADGISHYLRGALQTNNCIDRTTTPVSGCASNMGAGSAQVNTPAQARSKLVRLLSRRARGGSGSGSATVADPRPAAGAETSVAATDDASERLRRKLDQLLGPEARR